MKLRQYRLKTGNKKHKPTSPSQRERAKQYGLAHGFDGALGGWIYNDKGEHVAHGWGQFWHKYKRSVTKWEVDIETQ